MLKYSGLISLIFIVTTGCASTTQSTQTTSFDAEALKTRWDMEGRGPEWRISINDQRFHGSFPGRYEGRVVQWDVTEKGDKTYLKSKNKLAQIELTESKCIVADQEFSHSAIVKINQQTFQGCAKHKL